MARPILTTLVGSYPIPEWLSARPTEQGMRDALAAVIHLQELAGIDVITDGEFYRFDSNHPETSGMIDYFIRGLRNVRPDITRSEERIFHTMEGMSFRHKPAGVVEGQIGEGTINLPRAYQRSRSLTRRKLKFTVTSPYHLGKTLVDRHYRSREALVEALADVLASQISEIDADIVQIDDENITGHPEDTAWAAPILNRIFDAVPHKAALHLCFGNYNGQTIQTGHWGSLIAFLNELHIDHVVAEMTTRSEEELACFKGLRPEIGLGLGVVDVKRTVIETPEDIARRLEHVEKVIGRDRVSYIHPDCGLWMLPRSVADAKIAVLAKGRDLYLAGNK